MRHLPWLAGLLAGCGADPPPAPASQASSLVPSEQRTVSGMGLATFWRASRDEPPKHLVLRLADVAGDSLAAALGPEYLVVDLSPTRLKRRARKKEDEGCWELAGDLQAAGWEIGRAEKMEEPVLPLLAGDGEGAALAWAAMAQSPDGAFAGLVVTGFCPRLDFTRTLCSRGRWQPDVDASGIQSIPPLRNVPLGDDDKPAVAVAWAPDCAGVETFKKLSPLVVNIDPRWVPQVIQARLQHPIPAQQKAPSEPVGPAPAAGAPKP